MNYNSKSNNYYEQPKTHIKSPFIKELYHEPNQPITDIALQEVIQGVVDIEGEDLDVLLGLIKLDCLAYIRKGCTYAEIKFKHKYKETHSNFDAYAPEVLGVSTKTVMANIHASRIGLILLFAGFSYEELPTNMSQAYALHCALSNLYEGDYSDQQLIEKWTYVLENIDRHKRSSDSIRELLNPTPVRKEDFYTKIELPLAVYTKLLKVAYHAKLSVSKVIENVISVLTSFKKQEIFCMFSWILDMRNLVDNHATEGGGSIVF